MAARAGTPSWCARIAASDAALGKVGGIPSGDSVAGGRDWRVFIQSRGGKKPCYYEKESYLNSGVFGGIFGSQTHRFADLGRQQPCPRTLLIVRFRARSPGGANTSG